MLAVVEIQGKQYIITEETTSLETDSFKDVKVGDKVVIDKVLLYQEKEGDDTVFGTPYIDGKKFEFEITAQEKGEKKLGIKFKKRHRYLKRKNHRQMMATLSVGGKKAPTKSKKTAQKKETTTNKAPVKAKAPSKKPVAKKNTAKKVTPKS